MLRCNIRETSLNKSGAQVFLSSVLTAVPPSVPPSRAFLIPCGTTHRISRLLKTSSYCLGNGRGKVDPRLADVVRYRLGRKEAHSTAAGILEEFTAPAPPAPSTPPAGDATDPTPEEAQEEEE